MIKQVTTVGAAASVILTPGTYCKEIWIQNNGSGNVRLSIDGGTSWTDAWSGKTGTLPTASTGLRVAAGNYYARTMLGDKISPPILAILETGTTTTLDIVTDDFAST